MDLFCGIDLGTRSSALCFLNKNDEIAGRWEGKNEDMIHNYERLAGGARVHSVVEASPLAETVCAAIEAAGGSIEIVDSRSIQGLYQHKKKTDRLDAESLSKVNRIGWYTPVYRKSGRERELRSMLKARDALVRTSTQLKNSIRGLLKANGLVLEKNVDRKSFAEQVRVALRHLPSGELRGTLEGVLTTWEKCEKEQKELYKTFHRRAKSIPEVANLLSVPGVGPLTALAFYATIGTHTRFKNGERVASYIGLTPRVHQSGDISYRGRVSKQGDRLLRWLLIEAAGVLLTRSKTEWHLKTWGRELKERKGSGKAKVAVARKLAMVLFSILQTNEPFQSVKNA